MSFTAHGELFELPAEKRNADKTTCFLSPDIRPKNFLENLMSPSTTQVLWDFAFGEIDYVTGDNIAVAEQHQLLLISSGAPCINRANKGALWALS